jgi:hypothetical protein
MAGTVDGATMKAVKMRTVHFESIFFAVSPIRSENPIQLFWQKLCGGDVFFLSDGKNNCRQTSVRWFDRQEISCFLSRVPPRGELKKRGRQS